MSLPCLHLGIAEATGNSALIQKVRMYWEQRHGPRRLARATGRDERLQSPGSAPDPVLLKANDGGSDADIL